MGKISGADKEGRINQDVDMNDEEKDSLELSLPQMLFKELGFGEDLIIDEDDKARLQRLP